QRHREIDDVLLARRGDQPGRQRVADDGKRAALAVGVAGVLGADHAVERPRRRQAAQADGALGPHHAVLEARVVRRLGQVRLRPFGVLSSSSLQSMTQASPPNCHAAILSVNARPNSPALGSPDLGRVTEWGGTSSCVPVLPSRISTSLLYALSGPIF